MISRSLGQGQDCARVLVRVLKKMGRTMKGSGVGAGLGLCRGCIMVELCRRYVGVGLCRRCIRVELCTGTGQTSCCCLLQSYMIQTSFSNVTYIDSFLTVKSDALESLFA